MLMEWPNLLAMCLMGLGMHKQTILDCTGITADQYRGLHTSKAKSIKDMRANPHVVKALLLEWQQEQALASGFALSHSPTIAPRDLRQVASTAAILAKSATSQPAKAKASPAKDKPPQRPV